MIDLILKNSFHALKKNNYNYVISAWSYAHNQQNAFSDKAAKFYRNEANSD